MKDKLLPIGSVVTVGNDNTSIMIDGYGITNNSDKKFYDYSGVVYPIGFNTNDVKLFNRNDISTVLFIGYQSKDFRLYRDNISEFIQNIRSGKTMEEAANILEERLIGGK